METTRRKYDYQKIFELRSNGCSLNQIANVFNTNKGTIGQICRKLGLGGVLSDRATTAPEDPKKYVENFLPDQFSYVSGYVDCNSLLKIKCKDCSEIFARDF